MTRLICFDLDNTLIYSDKAHLLAYNYALKKMKLKLPKTEFLKSLFGMPHYLIINIIAPGLSGEEADKLVNLHDDILIKKTYKYSKQIPGVIKTLTLLKKDYALALLSNSSHKNILSLLKGSKVDRGLFKFVIGNDDVKHAKPWPDEIFKAEKLEHHKADFMIGDSIYDVMAGKRARIKTISVLTGHYSRILLKKQGANYIINSVRELPKLLKLRKKI
jgi:phosphoglycolate phosphatase-like HAD superfamily hydrolase